MQPHEVFSKHNTAVLVVDIQADFTEYAQGALAAQDTGLDYLKQVREATEQFKQQGYFIFATQDWHPANHISFYTNHPNQQPFNCIRYHDRQQILWPPHCIQNTPGAELLLDKGLFQTVIRKGSRKEYDSYSGFADDQGLATDLHDELQKQRIERLIIYGIAIEYCVKATALDALELGYQVSVIKELCRGITDATISTAWQTMRQAGVRLIN